MINTDSIEITPMTMKDSDTFSFFNYWGKCGPVTIVEKIILIGIQACTLHHTLLSNMFINRNKYISCI